MVTEDSTVTGLHGASYRIGTLIGAGGEGAVYAVQGTQLVAKIYKKVDPDHEGKLRYMVNHPIPRVVDQLGNPILNAAWPQDIIYDSSKNFAGYVMPRIETGIEIFEVERGCTMPKAKEKFPNYTWRLNVLVARNLAASVNILHSQGYVIGDMNSKNFLVNADGSICLLDTDSIDMTDPATKKHYQCCVGMQDYLPPELQGRDLRASRFTTESDSFGLAVHIFQLLMNNYHPFSAKQMAAEGSFPVNPQMDRIVQGMCPYLHSYPGLTIPVGAPRLEDVLPDYIIENFQKTFSYTSANAMAAARYRTTPRQWMDSLRRLLQECDSPNGLVRCRQDPTHFYLQSKGRCGLCSAKDRYTAAAQPFPVADGLTAEELYLRGMELSEWSHDRKKSPVQRWNEALPWFQRAAALNHVKAQTELGHYYSFYRSSGFPEDPVQAVYWYRKAAEQGDSTAQCKLGRCLERGYGAEKDCAQALHWYRKAADQGHTAAMYDLSRCFQYGIGTEKDPGQAEYWQHKATGQTRTEADAVHTSPKPELHSSQNQPKQIPRQHQKLLTLGWSCVILNSLLALTMLPKWAYDGIGVQFVLQALITLSVLRKNYLLWRGIEDFSFRSSWFTAFYHMICYGIMLIIDFMALPVFLFLFFCLGVPYSLVSSFVGLPIVWAATFVYHIWHCIAKRK